MLSRLFLFRRNCLFVSCGRVSFGKLVTYKFAVFRAFVDGLFRHGFYCFIETVNNVMDSIILPHGDKLRFMEINEQDGKLLEKLLPESLLREYPMVRNKDTLPQSLWKFVEFCPYPAGDQNLA
jgi:hypothetical protein